MLFSLIKAAILGVVEGVTEFLPISSTGHLIIVNQWISFNADFTKLFDIVIQLGAILSVVVFFWNRLWPFGKDKESYLMGLRDAVEYIDRIIEACDYTDPDAYEKEIIILSEAKDNIECHILDNGGKIKP